MKVADLKSIQIKLASPEEILEWSFGEVKKPETINYRTQRPEKDGLFCEKIFGPSKDYECYCGKYKGIRYKNIVCDRCGVEVTKSQVRRERMGHIKLAAPVSHIWFLRGIPSRIGLVLDIPQQKLERVIYFIDYIIEKVDHQAQQNLLKELEEEKQRKEKEISSSKIPLKEKKKKREELRQLTQRRREEILSIKPLRIISEIEFQELSLRYGEIFTAGTGAEALVRIFEKVNLKKEIEKLKQEAAKSGASDKKKILRRLRFFQGMEKAKIRPEWMFLKVLPVLPPDLRPMVQLDGGRYASSDLNDLYRRVINRNNRLKYLIDISAPDVIVRNEKRMLQEAVDSLLDNSMRKSQVTTSSTGRRRVLKSLADILSGKQGRFRRNLLGKRVDYSGRSVIASGPELKLHQCGLPKIMALELFRPFIIKKLLDKEIAFNIKGASRLIDEKRDEVFAALEEVVKDKLVLLNRAPTLHRLGIQAFEPILIEGEAIKIHPLVCKAYNADFDGDQMAVHLPLSSEAQQESKELMLSSKNLLKPATGTPIVTPTLDIVLGCYWLTDKEEKETGEIRHFSSFEEAIIAYQLRKISLKEPIKVLNEGKKAELIETTCGRIIFNEAFPEDFPFVNEAVNAKKLSELVGEVIRRYPEEKVAEILDKIKDLGFEYSTISGLSLGMDDFIVPEGKKEVIAQKEKEIDILEEQYQKGFLSKEEKNSKAISIWQEAKREIEELVIKALPKDGPISIVVESGAKGSWAQPIQICGMKGPVASPTGKIIETPIKSSFKEGFDVLEFFISTHGARKGTVDTALRTSASGYLTRRLVDVSHEVIVTEEDCGDKEGVEIYRKDAEEVGQRLVFKIVGRVAAREIKDPKTKKTIVKEGEIIDWERAYRIEENQEIKSARVYSPLSCKTLRGVCRKCYGWEMGRNKMVSLGEAVGIIASQSIGEPGTQLTMRTFHLGGVAGGGDITMGLPRVEELFELRTLKEEGVISEVEGTVKSVDKEKGEVVVQFSAAKKSSSKKKEQEIKYHIPSGLDIYVKKGDKVFPGDPLSSGPLELKKLFKTSGLSKTQRYIINSVQRIYVGEGINIHDKHIEIIVRQMFSRVRIQDPGDGPWVPGQVVSRAHFEEVQRELKKENKKKATAQTILLGISRVALTSDSFLSAASFQETSRVLIKAALEGERDMLRGLKENVIIGRLIPAGTGFRKYS
jgi:DNA-directed RNA polymerase subunit beta'